MVKFSRSHAPAWECVSVWVPTQEHGNQEGSGLPLVVAFVGIEMPTSVLE
jgi:hypothetical protein